MAFQRGLEKRVDRGPTLKFYCRPKAQEKLHFGESRFYCRRFFPGNSVTITLDNYPASTPPGGWAGGVRIGELLSERILVISAPPKKDGGGGGWRPTASKIQQKFFPQKCVLLLIREA